MDIEKNNSYSPFKDINICGGDTEKHTCIYLMQRDTYAIAIESKYNYVIQCNSYLYIYTYLNMFLYLCLFNKLHVSFFLYSIYIIVHVRTH